VKGTGFVQVTQEGATSVVVGTTTTLTSELGAKQPAISVSTANALPLLVGNVLASLGDSTTVLPKAEGDGAGGRRIYFQTVLGTSDIGGLQAALDLRAPSASPSFSGQPSFASCTAISGLTRPDGSFKDAGLASALSYQLGFYAPADGCTRVYTIAGHGNGDGWNRLGQYVDPNAGGNRRPAAAAGGAQLLERR
jgi:hypothetical protein